MSSPAPAASLDRLVSQVISPGLCVACGACLGLCPHLLFLDGQVAAPDPCGLEQGRCAQLCPVANRPPATEPAEGPLGRVKTAYAARAKAADLEGKAQYGGVVSTLAALALSEGLVGEAVLTAQGPRGVPQGVRATSREDILEAAGSIYAGAGTLGLLNQALSEKADHPLALVGLPCQILAASRMKGHEKYPDAERIGLSIGLFCTMNLPGRGLRALLKENGISGPVERSDFPPPPAGIFQVWSGGEYYELPLEQVRELRYPGCAGCPDLTAEGADISVGACEGREGWNTVLVRSGPGEALINLAANLELIELEPAAAESLEHLGSAATAKRTRAAEEQNSA
ncbi:MAG: Coenzyme F420 hydrogenase/dehydrogenase, beta subunit C-terminal domain [Desulfarculaceae bacterium]|nr:Coenzyme F420 hydrogenase/dehydrogenase, beta subunit C-terminal domain [Desulfarculaceae bacterium]MCF8071043.1 Coenzyme F420 hydrogenase/dehydrogenase, beta subunit C-terminal domain [Desulfarculaceae bacterium]MCF8100631.1 Coenzyme F420 hydrogenase/dehydrogenase, beta subunit C-terminal domain [Desulfarculaceae bacterium]MCF8116935.1 Coenzyme F420 hydrogenase/dehydrogenase, beta subunit C-terminal domain [Desulfarculaceae bacterium]